MLILPIRSHRGICQLPTIQSRVCVLLAIVGDGQRCLPSLDVKHKLFEEKTRGKQKTKEEKTVSQAWVRQTRTSLSMIGPSFASFNSLFMTYRIRPFKCTVRLEVGKIFCRRGVVKHPYNRTPQ